MEMKWMDKNICVQCGEEYNPEDTVNNYLEICNACQIYMGLVSDEQIKDSV